METESQSPDPISADATTAPTVAEVQAGITQAVTALVACVL